MQIGPTKTRASLPAWLAPLLFAMLLVVILLGYLRAGRELLLNPFPFDLFLIALVVILLPPRPEVWGGNQWLRYVVPLLFSVALFVNAGYVADKFAKSPTPGSLFLLQVGESTFFLATFVWILVVPGQVWPTAKLHAIFRVSCVAVGLLLTFEGMRFFREAKGVSPSQIQPQLRYYLHMALALVLLAILKTYVPPTLSKLMRPKS